MQNSISYTTIDCINNGFSSIVYSYRKKDKQDLKEACINHDEKWKNDECKFPHGNKGEEDKAYEDYVCDDPEDSKKWRKICG